jgi:hypothetical protein
MIKKLYLTRGSPFYELNLRALHDVPLGPFLLNHLYTDLFIGVTKEVIDIVQELAVCPSPEQQHAPKIDEPILDAVIKNWVVQNLAMTLRVEIINNNNTAILRYFKSKPRASNSSSVGLSRGNHSCTRRVLTEHSQR